VVTEAPDHASAQWQTRLHRAEQMAQLGNWNWDIATGAVTLSPGAIPYARTESGETTFDAVAALVHPDDRPEFERVIGDALTTGASFVVQYRVVKPDGVVRHLENRGEVERDAAGHPVRMFGTVQDITARKQAEEALLQADRAKNEFLAVLSHELQTPLTSMLGWSEEALCQSDPAFMTVALQVIHRNAQRQRRLVDEMLDLSCLLHRKIVLHREQLDLCTQAQQAVEQIRPQAERLNLRVQCEVKEALPISADPVRLQQCIGNLLHNSLKFTPAGGAITVRCAREDHQAALTVADTGRGIPADTVNSLFHAFQQIDRNERYGGLGLGLSVTRGLIELHGGQIRATSAGIGHGSAFTILLPLIEME
jgi:signal transduction histidine kinase